MPLLARLRDLAVAAAVMHPFYLHGFASSARSSKGVFLAARFGEKGIALRSPDFNEPDFESLTITRMIEQVGRELDEVQTGPVVLIGSSLGAFVAIQAARRWPERVDRLVLMAPAVDLRPERLGELGDSTLAEWKANGRMNIFHFGHGRVMPLGYTLFEDAQRYDGMNIVLAQPIQIFQGRRDAAVDPVCVEGWAASRPNVELHMLDDDHQLHASLEYMWRELSRFLFEETTPNAQLPTPNFHAARISFDVRS